MAPNKKQNFKDKMTNLANTRWEKKRKNEAQADLDENNNYIETDFNNLSITEEDGSKCSVSIQCEVLKRDFGTQTSYNTKKNYGQDTLIIQESLFYSLTY